MSLLSRLEHHPCLRWLKILTATSHIIENLGRVRVAHFSKQQNICHVSCNDSGWLASGRDGDKCTCLSARVRAYETLKL